MHHRHLKVAWAESFALVIWIKHRGHVGQENCLRNPANKFTNVVNKGAIAYESREWPENKLPCAHSLELGQSFQGLFKYL